MLNIETGKLSRLTNPILNANLGDVINWNHDSKSIFVKVISPNKKSLIDKLNIVPEGPTISTNFGKKAQNRTYQDREHAGTGGLGAHGPWNSQEARAPPPALPFRISLPSFFRRL